MGGATYSTRMQSSYIAMDFVFLMMSLSIVTTCAGASCSSSSICYMACNHNQAPSSTEFELYKRTSCSSNDIMIMNNSTIYSCSHCGSQCPIVVWCVATDGPSPITVDLMWNLPSNTWSLGTVELCLCSHVAGDAVSNCQSSSMEGVYTCTMTQTGGNNAGDTSSSSILQFIHNVNEVCTPHSLTPTTSPTAPSASPTAASCLMEDCSTVCLMQETPLSYLNMSSILSLSISSSLLSSISSSCSSTVTEQQVSSTTPLLTISSSCSSTVASEQVSTTPYYAGIGLLVATNLITIILLISSCVYISSQRKKSKL